MSAPPDANAACDNYKNTRFARELVNQLLLFSRLRAFEHKHEALLFRSLYFALSDHDQFYDFIFPREKRLILYPRTWDEVNQNTFNKSFYLDQVKNKSRGHTGHICASSIPQGRLVYNCYDCGVDATCCLCEDCFNKEEHSDHNVSVHKSSGDAICDCGDDSSWKVDLLCKANETEAKLKSALPQLPAKLKENISILVRVLFDFILDVQLTNLSPLPALPFHNPAEDPADFLAQLAHTDTLPAYTGDQDGTHNGVYSTENDEGRFDVVDLGDLHEYYCLVIWNDEFHNFDQANSFLSVAYQFSPDYHDDNHPWYEVSYKGYADFDFNKNGVTQLARIIDERGFVVYARSKDRSVLEKKIDKFKKYKALGYSELRYSLITATEYVNLSICRAIILWFDVILENENVLLTDYIKQELSKVLFEPANFHLKSLPLFGDLIDTHFLVNENLEIPLYKEVISSDATFTTPIHNVTVELDDSLSPTNSLTYYKNASRLQYLTFFEMRYPKSMRKLIKKTIIPIITNTADTRSKFAQQVMSILTTLEYNAAKNDREWRLSILETFRLQVYHDPNLGTELLRLGYLTNVLDSILAILISSSSLVNGKYHIVAHDSWKVQRTVEVLSQAVGGLSVILNFLHEGREELFIDDFIYKLLRLFTAFDEIYKLKRKTDIYEEFQDHRTCEAYHNSVRPMYTVSQSLARICYGFKNPNEKVEKSIALISSYLKAKPRTYTESGAVLFNITEDGVSMSHPVGDLLAELSRGYKFYTPELLSKSISHISHNRDGTSSFEIDPENALTSFVGVADEMLQPWVFHSQISSNFWIRNGIYVTFANYFFDAYKPENNLYIIQQGIITDQLPLQDIIDRFMLESAISGDTEFESTTYEEKIPIILHEFMSLMYYLLTFRQYYDSNLTYDQCLSLFNEYCIASILAPAPLKYSEMEDSFPSCPNFDEILNQITTYVSPTSYNDYGRYTLKDSYWNKVDPFSYFHGKVSSSEVEEAVVKNLAIIKNKKEDDVIISPYLYPLSETDLLKFQKVGQFMKSAKFVKVLYKLLRFAVTSEVDSHLNMILQLIHAIILDDELYNKEDSHGLKSFVEIPICNLLLTAAEKTDLPKYVSKKASTILELLLLKDDDVLTSLMLCFGESHMEEYKKSKHGKTLETKLERRRRLALKRQKKVLKKMKKQQSAFVDNNKNFFDASGSKDNDEKEKDRSASAFAGSKGNETETRNCIICKNPETNESLFGIPALISTSSNYWTIPTIDDDPPFFMVKEFSKASISHPNASGQSSCTRDKLVIFGCPHGMHYSCFQSMLHKKKMSTSNFTCPLCKGKYNIFVPSFKLGEIEVDSKGYEPIRYNEERIYSHFYGDNISSLTNQIFHKPISSILSESGSKNFENLMAELLELKDENLYLKKCTPPFKSLLTSFYRYSRKGYYVQFSLPLLIASTLEMHEIATRSDHTIIIPEMLDLVLKSLLQYRILTNNENLKGEREKKKYYEFLLNNPYLGFMETTMLLFTESDIPLSICVQFSLMKRVIYTAFSLLQRNEVNSQNLQFDSLLDDVEDIPEHCISYQSLINILESVVQNSSKVDGFKFDGSFVQKLYKLIKTNLKNFERQAQFLSLFLNTLPLEEGETLLPDLDEFLANSLNPNSNEAEFQKLLVKGIPMSYHEKTFPKCHKRDNQIDIIEYPKGVHLIELPAKLKDIALTGMTKTEKVVMGDVYENSRVGHVKCSNICLHCGKWVHKSSEHGRECKLSGYGTLFFTPMKNRLTLLISRMVTDKSFIIESPYLNKHGEPSKGLVGLGDAGTLSRERYEHLQRMWFNQNIIGSYIRDSTREFSYLPMASNATSEVYIPGIFEPAPDSMPPAAPNSGTFRRLLGFPDVMFDPEIALLGLRNVVGIEDDDEDDDEIEFYENTDYVSDEAEFFVAQNLPGTGERNAEVTNFIPFGLPQTAGEADDDDDEEDEDYNDEGHEHEEDDADEEDERDDHGGIGNADDDHGFPSTTVSENEGQAGPTIEWLMPDQEYNSDEDSDYVDSRMDVDSGDDTDHVVW